MGVGGGPNEQREIEDESRERNTETAGEEDTGRGGDMRGRARKPKRKKSRELTRFRSK